MRKASLILIAVLAFAGLGFLAVSPGSVPRGAQAKPAQTAGSELKGVDLLKAVLDRVRAEYIDKPDDAKLIESAINGMLSALDPHSDYLDARRYRDLQTETRGEFGGVGIRVIMENGLVKVVAAMEETPAARAGVMVDDIITHLDDEPLHGLSLREVVDRMRGPINSKVRVSIRRNGASKPLTLSLVRDSIKMRAVEFHKEGVDVGYIRLMHFNYQAADGVKTAIRELSKQRVSGFIVDLRNNPGGLINQAITVAGNFLDAGEIVSLRGRDRSEDERFDSRSGSGDLTKGKRVVVLINGGSASAAEIVAGALQDNKRALVVGTRSYGKGSVQTIIPLGTDSGALRLTTARYYTPAGHSIQAQGIQPDIEVVQDVPKAMLASAEIAGEASLPGHLKADGEERIGSQSYVPANPKDDKALHVALEILRGAQGDATAASARAGAAN